MKIGRELVFSIGEFKLEPVRHLILFLEEVERNSLGEVHFGCSKRNLYLASLKELTPAKDHELLGLLIKEEMRVSRLLGLSEDLETKALNRIRIESPIIPLMKRLAATGRLYFKRHKVKEEFSRVSSFLYRIHSAGEGKLQVEGYLKDKWGELPLVTSGLVVAGPPHWYIHENCLRTIGGAIEWKWISSVLQGPNLFTRSKWEQLLEKYEEEIGHLFPHSEWLDKEESKIAPQPIPVLKLADRFGAFANLWVNYEGKEVLVHDPLGQMGRQNGSYRDLKSEKEFEKDLLETDFVVKPVGSSYYYCSVDKVAKSLIFLLECGWKVVDYRGLNVVRQLSAELLLTDKGTKVLVSGRVAYENFQADISSVVGAFNRKERFVQLSANQVGLLDGSALEQELAPLLEGEVVSEGVTIKKSHLYGLKDLWEIDSHSHLKKQVILDETLSGLRSRLAQMGENTAIALPSPAFQATLRPYQLIGLNWLSFLQEFGLGGILADEMGLGKTVQVLALLSRLTLEDPVLIVVPTSLLFNWKREVERLLPFLSHLVYHGADREKEVKEMEKISLILTSYSILRLEKEKFSRMKFSGIILDEAHLIKNAQTLTAQAIYQLSGHFRLCLTGTPIENQLQDLWAQFRFLMPDLLGDMESFTQSVAAAQLDGRYLDQIRRKVAPFILKRYKSEVAADLPEKIEQVVWVEMEPGQREVYEAFLSGVKSGLLRKIDLDGIASHRMELFEAILRLRQICCHPLLVDTHLIQGQEKIGLETSGKWQALFQDLQTIVAEKQKGIVYSQFTSILQMMKQEAIKNQWKVVYLDGSTKNREEVVRQFQEDPEVQLFFVSLKAGGVGLNLTAADHVFLYDPWWNEAVENQAIDRAHRIGRKSTVMAKRYITVESIEEKMMKLKARKRSLSEGLFDEGFEGGVISEKEMLELLGLS